MTRKGRIGLVNAIAICAMLVTSGCAMVDIPDARNVNIPPPVSADARKKAVNERPDSVMYLPLGEDILVPEVSDGDAMPHEMVGPFELRGETLAGALQLILADYDISLAFETQEGLTRQITVANLRGDLGKVVNQVCSLANLYCSYDDGTIVIKDTQTFTVTLPPLGTGEENGYLDDVSAGLAAILGAGSTAPIVDPTTRTIVYAATQRTAEVATRYFQRLRANTAMIVFETYIWEVSLNSGNSTGIDWSMIDTFGKFNASVGIDGAIGADFLGPISIGLPTTKDLNGVPTDIVKFLSQFGAVKTISQPQITVLSGSEAELRVADTQNYVSQIATTLDQGQSTTSVNTDSVDTGFTLTIGSSWDKATVYANVAIELTDVKDIENFAFADTGDDGGSTTIQLPQTSERQLSTQIRVRPGDSVLIAGLVRENDNFESKGIGFMKPIIPDSRTAQAQNLELVILLRPRVIVYTAANDKRYVDYAMKKHKVAGTGEAMASPHDAAASAYNQPAEYSNVRGADAPIAKAAVVEAVQEEMPDSAPAPLSPAPVKVVPASPAPVTPAPVSSAPLPIAPAVASAPVSITPAPVYPAEPSWESAPAITSAPPANSDDSVYEDARFRRGSGFASTSTTSAPSTYLPPATAYEPPQSLQTEDDPLPPSTIPLYDPNAITSPPQASSTPSPTPTSAYETYDYYTPRY